MSTTTIQVSPSELGERLRQELTVTDWRAVIAVVVAAPGLEQAAEQACSTAMDICGLSENEIVRWVARRDDAAREQLRAINRGRDTLLREKRLIWLRTSSAADIRLLRKTAPDLTSAIDVFAELRGEVEPELDWPACREQLRALMEVRHGMLDFTGLLPATVAQHKLPLEKLYQPLVDSRPTDRGAEQSALGLLVLGHPGTGKTTFVRHLAWAYSQDKDPLDIGPKVPLLLSLSDYGFDREQDRVRSLVEFLPIWLKQQGIENTPALAEHLSEVLLLLDGLDEMRAPEARRSVLVEVSQLLHEKRVGGVVVTGRSFLVDELRQHDHVLRLASTQEPTQPQIQAFLTAFVNLRRGSHADAKDLISRIERDPDLRALARTPLMLAFMAILDELEGRLPDRRIEIYYRLGEMLVDRWTRARSIGTSASRRERPTRADALRVLGPLAWSTVDRGGGAIPELELTRELERIEGKRETPEEAKKRATALLELLRSDTALLVPQGRRWAFVHSSIGEYFAGVEVERDKQRWNALLREPFRPEWREIVLFCAGQLGVIEGRVDSLDALVRAVLAKSRRKGRYDAKYPSLLIGLLEEAPGLSRRQIDDLVKRLLELVMLMAYSPTAAEQMQREFVSLLTVKAHGPVADSLKSGLRWWFSNRAQEIDWERLLTAVQSHGDVERLSKYFGREPTALVARALILGPFIASLGEWVKDLGIDLQPTFARWRKEPDGRYRFAEWYVSSSAAARHRPFSEAVLELR
jgi:NACHT domain